MYKSYRFFSLVTFYCSLFLFLSSWHNFQVNSQWLRIWEYILISWAHTIYSYLRCALSFCLHRNHYCFKGWSLHEAAKSVTETAGAHSIAAESICHSKGFSIYFKIKFPFQNVIFPTTNSCNIIYIYSVAISGATSHD